MVVAYFVLMASALAATIFVAREIQAARFERDVERELASEVDSLRQIAEGGRPETGDPFGTDVRALFDTFLETNVAGDNEAFITIPLDAAGEPGVGFRYSFGAPAEVLSDTALVQRWAGATTPILDRFDTPAGEVAALVVPVLAPDTGGDTAPEVAGDGEATESTARDVLGVFVVTHFLADGDEALADLVRLLVVLAITVLLVTTVLAWILASRVVAPVRQLTATAQAITHSDLSARIPVEGHSELAELGTTFNEMIDRLDDGSRAQRQFLDDVAHDLRTPLTIARGHLEVLGDDPAERDAAIAVVLDELDRMGRSVSDLMLLAKSRRPDFLRLGPVDYGDFAADLTARVGALAARTWVVDAAPRPGMLAGAADADRLVQAVLNLAANAVEQTDDGAEIGIGVATDGADGVRLWVRDGGPGIDPATAETLFQRYGRGADDDNVHDGIGLGLAIVDAIARAHGGVVGHEPTPGGGATFTIRIPLEPPGHDGEAQ